MAKTVRRHRVVPGTPEPNPGTELWRQYLDHAWLPENSLNFSGVKVADGQPIKTLKDEIGNVDIVYAGVTGIQGEDKNLPDFPVDYPGAVGKPLPLLTEGVTPLYHSNPGVGGFLFLENQSAVQFQSAKQNASSYPRMEVMVILKSELEIFEAYKNNIDTDYLRDLKRDGFGTRNQASFDGDHYYAAQGYPATLNGYTLVWREFTDDITNPALTGMGWVNEALWINGVKVPLELTTYKRNNVKFGLGADTNNEHCGFMFYGTKMGLMSDSQRTSVMNELMTTFKGGQTVDVPYASNVRISRNGETYTLSYDYVPGKLGYPENKQKRIVKWIYVYGGVTHAIYIHELEGKMTFNNTTDLPSNFDYQNNGTTLNGNLRAEVIVFDDHDNYFAVPASVLGIN